MQNELNKANKIIEQQNITIINLQNQLNILNNCNCNNINLIQSYQNTINQKEQEINKLKLELQNNNSQNNECVNMNKIMAFLHLQIQNYILLSHVLILIHLQKLEKNYIINFLNIEKLIILLLQMEDKF